MSGNPTNRQAFELPTSSDRELHHRALVAAGADVLSIGESRHPLEDVYLELIDQDVGGRLTCNNTGHGS